MKRPIKFRGVGIDDETYFGDLLHAGKCIGIRVAGKGTFEVKPDSVAQLVGYDVDGNEVYEGDIVIGEYGGKVTAQLMDNLPSQPIKEATK